MRFDWSTLALQTINVLVLVWLLRRFLFRPVAAIVAARRSAAERLLADAAAARAAAEASAAAAAAHEQTLAAANGRLLAEVRAAAAAERTALLERAKQEAAQLDAAARAAVAQERAQMRSALASEARGLAVTIAERLLGRVPAAAIDAALLQSLDTWLASLPAEQLQALAPPGETLQVVTAAPLAAAAQAACREMLARRLGRAATLGFAADPSLLAGIELRGAHASLRNTWRADLDRIAQELSRDDAALALA